MQGPLAALRERWGSVDGYLDWIGVTPALRSTLRDMYRVLPSQL